MGNLKFVFFRLLGAIPTLLALICLAFFLVKAAPGGPFDMERSLPEEVEANLRAAYNLDDPLPKQLFKYIGDILQGDFGPSFQYRDFNVTELIMSGFPVSLRLGAAAILAALFFGALIGTVAALNQNTKIDYLVMFFGMTGISIPNFVMAPLLILLFSIFLNMLPAGLGRWQHQQYDFAGYSAGLPPGCLHCQTDSRVNDRGSWQQLCSHS